MQLRVKARAGGADFSRFIGDPAHGLPEGTFNFVNLALCRVSRRFARAVLQAIDTELNTSHHEIYIPYVFSRARRCLTHTQLTPDHASHILFNSHSTHRHLMTLRGFQRKAVEGTLMVAHPVK